MCSAQPVRLAGHPTGTVRQLALLDPSPHCAATYSKLCPNLKLQASSLHPTLQPDDLWTSHSLRYTAISAAEHASLPVAAWNSLLSYALLFQASRSVLSIAFALVAAMPLPAQILAHVWASCTIASVLDVSGTHVRVTDTCANSSIQHHPISICTVGAPGGILADLYLQLQVCHRFVQELSPYSCVHSPFVSVSPV